MRSQSTAPVIFDPLLGIIELREAPQTPPGGTLFKPLWASRLFHIGFTGSLLSGVLGLLICLLPTLWAALAPSHSVVWAGRISEVGVAAAQVLFPLGAGMGLLAVLGTHHRTEIWSWPVFGINAALAMLMIYAG